MFFPGRDQLPIINYGNVRDRRDDDNFEMAPAGMSDRNTVSVAMTGRSNGSSRPGIGKLRQTLFWLMLIFANIISIMLLTKECN